MPNQVLQVKHPHGMKSCVVLGTYVASLLTEKYGLMDMSAWPPIPYNIHR